MDKIEYTNDIRPVRGVNLATIWIGLRCWNKCQENPNKYGLREIQMPPPPLHDIWIGLKFIVFFNTPACMSHNVQRSLKTSGQI